MDGLDSYTRVIVNQASMSTCPTSHRLRILGGEGGGGLPARIPNIQSLTPLVATFAQQSTQR